MKRTIYDTPVINHFTYGLSWLFLRLAGWKMIDPAPDLPKFVLIGAPHTSNWDFVLTLAYAFVYGKRVFWMGKNSLFKFPFNRFFRWMGGIPIDRSKAHGVVAQTVEKFNGADELAICIAPEGARKRVPKWKTGFYHVAHGAGIPIVLGFLDYKKRQGGFGPVFMPTGDIEADMLEIRAFYATVTGRYPSQFTNE